jgi:hypothetical protein
MMNGIRTVAIPFTVTVMYAVNAESSTTINFNAQKDIRTMTTKQERGAVLLAEYKAADEAVEKARKALERANKKRSDVVKKLDEEIGKGPFTYQGVMLGKVVIRPSRDGEEVTYFLRGRDTGKGFKAD